MEELTSQADLKVDTTFAVHYFLNLNFKTMVRSSKKKDKDKETASKTCTSPRKEQSATAGDEEEEASTSQRDG